MRRSFFVLCVVSQLLVSCTLRPGVPNSAKKDDEDVPLTSKEILLVPQLELIEHLTSTYQAQVDGMWTNLPPMQRKQISRPLIIIDTESKAAFDFRATQHGEALEIRLALSSILAHHKIAEFITVEDEILLEPMWFLCCLGFSRAHDTIPHVQDVLGWDYAERFPQLRQSMGATAGRMIYFIMAHELGHAVLGHLKIPEEVSLTKAQRRQQEFEADQFAFALCEEYEPGMTLQSTLELLACWALLNQGVNGYLDDSSHPPEYKRAEAALDYVAKHRENVRDDRLQTFELLVELGRQVIGGFAIPGGHVGFQEFLSKVKASNLVRPPPAALPGTNVLTRLNRVTKDVAGSAKQLAKDLGMDH